jgi:hypothetical protein
MQGGSESSYRFLVPDLVIALCILRDRLNLAGLCRIFRFRLRLTDCLADAVPQIAYRYIHWLDDVRFAFVAISRFKRAVLANRLMAFKA